MFDYFLEVPSLENDRNIREKSMSKSVSQFFGAEKSELRKKIHNNRNNNEDNRGKHETRYQMINFFNKNFLNIILC
jgi:hypothetical protein